MESKNPRYLLVCDHEDERDERTVAGVISYVLRGMGPEPDEVKRMNLSPEQIECQVTDYCFVLVIHSESDGSSPLKLGPKSAAAIWGCQRREVPYLVLVPHLFFRKVSHTIRQVTNDFSEGLTEAFLLNLQSVIWGDRKVDGIVLPYQKLTTSLDEVVHSVVSASVQATTVTDTSSSG